MIPRVNIHLNRGDDETKLIELILDNNKPYDVSQVERVDMHVKVGDLLVLEFSSLKKGLSIPNPPTGQIILDVTSDMTQDMQWSSGNYDMQLTYKDGRVRTIFGGILILKHDITRVKNG